VVCEADHVRCVTSVIQAGSATPPIVSGRE